MRDARAHLTFRFARRAPGDLFALVSFVFSPNVLLGFGGIEKFRLDPAIAATANRERC